MPVKLRPEVVTIPFGSDRHNQILEAVRQRYQMSRFYMSQRYPAWQKQEERFMAYVNLTQNDLKRNDLKKTGKPQYVTIDVPYSYSMLLTAHTYWTSVFLARNPMLQYQAWSGAQTSNEDAVETLMNYQVQAANMQLPLYLWFMDAGKYGLGVVGNSWYEEQKIVTDVEEVPMTYLGMQVFGKTKKVRTTKLISGYTGNKTFNIRPQDFFPDPRVPIYRLQDGEFCGRMIEAGWNTVLKRQSQGYYFNVDELRRNLKTTRDYLRDRGTPQIQLPAGMDTLFYKQVEDPQGTTAGHEDKNQKSFVELFEITIELVPADWGLGTSTYPEKWNFTIGNMTVILGCQPSGTIHNKFEYFPLEYEIEGYGLTKRSMLEIVDPLNDVMSWLFNSHMYNVRKTLNDQMLVDPSRIVMKDLTDPTSGRIIRLKPEAYGTDPAAAVHQLAVADVTQNNIKDLEVVADIMQRVLGVTDNLMGMVNAGGRKTATEVRTSSTFGINRLKTMCEYMSSMGFTPWAEVMLQNTQQRYDAEQVFRINGADKPNPFMTITPEMIAGKYMFEPIDGTMPIDRFAQANLWREMAAGMAQNPQLAQQTDWMGLYGYIAQLCGLKNFDRFKINVVPDEVAMQNAQRGNTVPIGGGVPGVGPNQGGAAPAARVPGGGGDVGGSPVAPGVGRTS